MQFCFNFYLHQNNLNNTPIKENSEKKEMGVKHADLKTAVVEACLPWYLSVAEEKKNSEMKKLYKINYKI